MVFSLSTILDFLYDQLNFVLLVDQVVLAASIVSKSGKGAFSVAFYPSP